MHPGNRKLGKKKMKFDVTRFDSSEFSSCAVTCVWTVHAETKRSWERKGARGEEKEVVEKEEGYFCEIDRWKKGCA